MSRSKRAKEIKRELSTLSDHEAICEHNLTIIASRKMQLKRELDELGVRLSSPRKGGLTKEQIIQAKASLLK